MTVQGTGGGSFQGTANFGIILTGTGATITSGGGNVSVTGQGGLGNGGANYGISMGDGDVITAGGSGSVTVMGTGGNTPGGDDAGVVVAGVNAAATITSSGGNVSVTGQGGGTGGNTDNIGVAVDSMSTITAGGSGTVTVTGTGGNTTGVRDYGVWLNFAGATITSAGGAVDIVGTAGGGSGSSGIEIDAGTTVSSGGAANLTIQTDSLTVNGTAVIQGGAAGNEIVTLVVLTPGTNIDLGGADAAGTLGLTNAELGTITAGILRIGDEGGVTSDITVSSAITDVGTGWNTLSLATNSGISGNISQGSGDSLTVTDLRIFSSETVNLTDPGNAVSQLSGIASGAVAFVDSTSLTVGNVDPTLGFPGLETGFGGAITLTVSGTGNLLTVTNAIDTTPFGSTRRRDPERRRHGD